MVPEVKPCVSQDETLCINHLSAICRAMVAVGVVAEPCVCWSEAMTPASPDPGPAVRYEVAGGGAWLTMDRPATRNALTAEIVAGLAAGLARAETDPEVRFVVLTHTGPAFCAGADLRATPPAQTAAGSTSDAATGPSAPAAGGSSAPAATVAVRGLPAVMEAIARSPLPVVARLHGHAMAGGVGLAAACDLSIASDNVLLGFTEVRLGVAPAVISVVCLPKLRRSDALELFLTGERITATRAAAVGLITRAVPLDDLDAAVERTVRALVAGGPKALAATKRLVYDVPDLPPGVAYEQLAELSAALFASEEGTEGRAAFREKRPAAWITAAAPAAGNGS
jgi:methylglutaconyl-CoA hydratase